MPLDDTPSRALDIAVIGTGVSGLAAAWLLAQRHRVTVYEQDRRVGGHCHTVRVDTASGPVEVDTGFVVYNERTYPNLTALFALLGVPTQPSTMSFAVSLEGGRLEYAGTGLGAFFAQRRNLARPRHWRMLADILRFYREAPHLLDGGAECAAWPLGAYLDARGYSRGFADDHLLPMAGAIWSTPPELIREHPVGGFVRFFHAHGLLALRDRPQWRTVTGGSAEYVRRISAPFSGRIRTGAGVARLRRAGGAVFVAERDGTERRHDHAVIATHADQALAMLADPGAEERRLLGEFRYRRNRAMLHGDAALMPVRRSVWSSWNYMGRGAGDGAPAITYWMNRLHDLRGAENLFVSLNPLRAPRDESVLGVYDYDHPLYDMRTERAQGELWRLQGGRNTWFCGAYFGAGFHEDGLQAGLAVAEALGGLRRPWGAAGAPGRIVAPERFGAMAEAAE